MAGNGNRSKQILLANLPKRGWIVNGATAVQGEYTLECRDDAWVLFKGSGSDKKEIATATYGSSQMGDVRAALKRDGFDMAVVAQGPKTPKAQSAEKATESGKKRTESMTKSMDEKRNAFVALVETEHDWVKEGADTLTKGDYLLTLKKARWVLTKKGDTAALASGRYVPSEYAEVEEVISQE